MTKERQLNVEPIISYPRQAQPGETYLLTVDLRFSAEDWPYEEEEYPVHCMLDTGDLFSQEPIGDGAVILHRFGGSYGAAMFLLKAANEEMEGVVRVNLVNRWGMPFKTLEFSDIKISEKTPSLPKESFKVSYLSPKKVEKKYLSNTTNFELEEKKERTNEVSLTTYNPFICGIPVSGDQFVGRKKELRFIVERIMNRGQSCAITGSPQSGKTSILECLRDSEQKVTLYGDRADNLIFSYVHISRLESKVNETLFWEYVLQPLQDRIADNPESPLFKTYEKCQQKGFKTYTLEALIKQIKQADWQLVLLLDKFYSLLRHDTLNSAFFFGSLRSLTSLSRGALTLITTENKSLKQLNQESQDKEWYNMTFSPFYNIFQEVILGPLSDSDIEKLLFQGGYFSEDDCRFIKNIAGGHPSLLQVAASLLWNAYKDGDEPDSTKRQQQVEQAFYPQVEETLNRIWQSWSSKMQEAFRAVAHLHTDRLSEFKQELEKLEKHGFVRKDENGNWCVYPSIFFTFFETNQPT
jgi:hypothetical protein